MEIILKMTFCCYCVRLCSTLAFYPFKDKFNRQTRLNWNTFSIEHSFSSIPQCFPANQVHTLLVRSQCKNQNFALFSVFIDIHLVPLSRGTFLHEKANQILTLTAKDLDHVTKSEDGWFLLSVECNC